MNDFVRYNYKERICEVDNFSSFERLSSHHIFNGYSEYQKAIRKFALLVLDDFANAKIEQKQGNEETWNLYEGQKAYLKTPYSYVYSKPFCITSCSKLHYFGWAFEEDPFEVISPAFWPHCYKANLEKDIVFLIKMGLKKDVAQVISLFEEIEYNKFTHLITRIELFEMYSDLYYYAK